MVVVAAKLPIAGAIGGGEVDTGEPLRALPEIEIRHEGAHRGAVGASDHSLSADPSCGLVGPGDRQSVDGILVHRGRVNGRFVV